MKRRQLIVLAAMVFVACVDGGRSSGPSFAISDYAHGGSTPGFYFLPPVVPQPTISEQFNAFLQPLVRICPLDDADHVVCGSAPIKFTRATGPGSGTIRVSTLDKHYIVNWHTDQPPAVEPGERYRIEVFADPMGTVQLGFADVGIAATGKEAKNITNGSDGETIGLVDGKTLVIKFFAGIGALGQCTPGGPTCAEAVVPPEGGLVVAVNADGEAEAFADFPANWNDQPTTVMLERLPNAPPPLGAPVGQQQFPLFYEFEAFESDGEGGLVPAGQFQARVRIGVCNIEDASDALHPEPRGDMSLGMGGPGEFRTLPLVDASDILGMCEGITLAIRSGEEAKGWRALLARAAAVATDVILPRPLHARSAVVLDGGMGGSTDSFESPVGTVEGRPDLIVDDISIFPTIPEPGDAITITAEIRNIGSIHAGRFLVTIDVSGLPPFEQELWCPNLVEGESPLTASLAPFEQSEESCFVSRTVRFEAAGDFTVTARADAVGDLVTESNEENNTRTETFTVAEPPPSGLVSFHSTRDAGDFEIYRMSPDGSGQTRLTNNVGSDFGPDVSFNGTKIAFHRDVGEASEIYVMNADGSGLTRITENAFHDAGPVWSPDGAKLAFRTTRDGNFEIYVMNADGSGQTRLTSNVASDFDIDWSPDGNKLAFSSNRSESFQVHVMNADGTGVVQLTSTGESTGPRWSPDGTKIAFTGFRGENSDIYVMNADGTGEVRLTTHTAFDGEPSWCPDGRIVFTSHRDGNFEIYTMNADGTGQARLTVNSFLDRQPSCGGEPPVPPIP